MPSPKQARSPKASARAGCTTSAASPTLQPVTKHDEDETALPSGNSNSLPFPKAADAQNEQGATEDDGGAASPTAAGRGGKQPAQPRKKRGRTDELKPQGKKSPAPLLDGGKGSSTEKRKPTDMSLLLPSSSEAAGDTTTATTASGASPLTNGGPSHTQLPPPPPQYCDVDEEDIGSPSKKHQPEKFQVSGTEGRPFSISSGTATVTTPVVAFNGEGEAPNVAPRPLSVSTAATEIVFYPHGDGDVSIGRCPTDNEEDAANDNSANGGRLISERPVPARVSNLSEPNGMYQETGDSPPPRPTTQLAAINAAPAPRGGSPPHHNTSAVNEPPIPSTQQQQQAPHLHAVEPVALLSAATTTLFAGGGGNVAAAPAPASARRRQMTLNDFQPPPPIEITLRKELDEKSCKIDALTQRVAQLEADVAHRGALHEDALRREALRQDSINQYRMSLMTVMQDLAQTVRRDARREQHQRHFELGHIITAGSSGSPFAGSNNAPRETWVEGNRTRELFRQQQLLAKREAYLTQERKDLEKKLALLRKQGATASAIADSFLKSGGTTNYSSDNSGGMSFASDENIPSPTTQPPPGGGNAVTNKIALSIADAIDAEERLQTLKRECDAIEDEKKVLQEKQTVLNAEKKVLQKEIRRIGDEDASEFAFRPAIGPAPASGMQQDSHGGSGGGGQFSPSAGVMPSMIADAAEGTSDSRRYVLINLLGKGGFSEVWKAYDLQTAQFVACKIHKVGREMSIQQRQSYLRHAERELEIMRNLNHPKVTKLLDVFEPEHTTDTFVAVMEYCAGTDLDTHLKIHRTMKELDAKTIMIQLIAALRHMADHPKPVIHYDLKPANILFEQQSTLCLDIKVTDFGLSKIIHNAEEEVLRSNHAAGIELTSQGTGTYWYLPPECFDTTRTPTITGKVDVWAAGVIFYQMLYGRRPFADGISQRQIWQEKLISLQATKKWEFPPTSATGNKVSDEAKAVIQRCLAANPNDRCDIFQLSADPYFRKVGKGAAAAAAVGAAARLATGGRGGQAAVSGALGTGDAGNNNMPPPAARGTF
ncbi:protein kinase, putative [Bodo saltans]|uniref:Protein kinase, putative n=1 Tax=Bodo saltans TaxID=75058 RepID=A0A0S4JMZ9_BODSA|nr:protein kinase, putative [Bodo saltans]|eukprot:CUG89893.1 protein kinase, putative [Bodo saltans]